MKKNSAAFLALVLSATMAVSPAASVMADGEISEQPIAEEYALQPIEETEQVEETASEDTMTENAEGATEDALSETPESPEEVAPVDSDSNEAPALVSEPEAPVSKTHEITCTTLNALGAVSGMYTMDKTIVTEQEDGSFLVRMHQASANRNLLAITDDVDKATNHEVDWNVGGGDDGYWFVIPVASLSQPVSVAFSSTDRVADGKAFGNIMTLNFDASSMTDTDAPEVTAGEIKIDPATGPEAPVSKTHEITCTTLNAQGAVSGMYTMDKTIVTEQEDGSFLVRMHQASANRNLLAITDDVDKATNHEVDWNVGGGDDGYWFVIPVASLSQPVSVAFSSTDRVADGKAFGNIMTLNFDASSMADTDAKEVTADEIKIDPAVEPEAPISKTHEITCTTLNAQGAVSGMYTMDKTIVTEQEDGTYLVRMHQASANRNLLALTDDVDKATKHEVDWNVGGGDDGYWFVIPVSDLSQPVSVAFSSTDRVQQGKAFGNIMTLNFDASSMADTDAKEVTADEIKIDPAVTPIDPVDPVDPSEPDTPDVPETPDVPDTPETKVPDDGIYSAAATTNASMFKVVDTKLTSKDGKMTAVITLSGTGYDYLFMGTKEEAFAADESKWIPAVVDENDKYTYEIPVEALDKELAVASRSAKYAAEGRGVDAWVNRTITIASDSLVKIGEIEEESALPDGIYTGLAETSASMFKVTATTLTSKDGKMSAVVTLSGTGYDYLFMGTKEEAFAANESKWIPAVVDADGKYTYEIPVEALDTPLAVASRSAKYAAAGRGVDAWINRTITIVGSSLTKVSDLPTEDPSAPTDPTDKPAEGDKPSTPSENKPSGGSEASGTEKPTGNDGHADNESKYESDLSGSTAAVNSSTSLKDGVYTPSSFSWSGGTGKVSISCNKVTVKDGKAYATIAFSSSKYGYVKANGNTYYPTVSGGSSIFTIPVALNKNQTIIGMTTAMSAAHEIAYNIFIAIPGAGGSSADTSQSASGMVSSDNSAMDEKAPEIIGLEYKSETKLEEAEYFKIFNYENDITLLEIDMTKDTERDPELEENKKSEKDDKKAEKSEKKDDKKAEKSEKKDDKTTKKSEKNADKKASDSDEEEAVTSEEETTAELYKGNVVKYLIVPEKEEIPVGLEKDMIVVQLPAEHLYMAAESGFAYLEDLEALDLIGSTAVKEKDCENKTIAKAMKDKKVVFGGKAEKPSFKDLVKGKTDLAVLPETLIPGHKDDSDKKDDKTKKDAKELEKEMKLFESMTERFAMLGIPVVFDRSEDEESDLAKAEWIKVYGVLANQQEKAGKLYDKIAAENK